MLPLVYGNPYERPAGASYTCFIFPFAYHLAEDNSSVSQSVCFRLIDTSQREWIQRQRYFTVDTAEVLFGHAKWFRIPAAEWERGSYQRQFQALLRSGPVGIELAPPTLILFEWQPKPQRNRDVNPFHTGFLILEAYFSEQQANPPTLDDLLLFNERFRFWRRPFEGYTPHLGTVLGRDFRTLDPEQVEKDETLLRELYLERWLRLLELPLQHPASGKRWRLFPQTWGEQARAWWRREHTSTANRDAEQPHCLIYADNRAFTWTCALVQKGADALLDHFQIEHKQGQEVPAEQLGYWIRLLNIDRPDNNPTDTHQTTAFERDWGGQRTYKRWAHFGTLYGFNYHAGAMLGAPCKDPPIWKHFRENYLDMVLLLLYLRITLFRFSRELSKISADARRETRRIQMIKRWRLRRRWRRAFEDMRWRFALFTNLYQFPLISNQQQAIEIYEKARKYLDIDQLFKEVEEEVKSSHEYQDMANAARINTWVVLLAVLGLPAAIIGAVTWDRFTAFLVWIWGHITCIWSLFMG